MTDAAEASADTQDNTGPVPEVRLARAIARLEDAVAALPDPDAAEMQDAVVLRQALTEAETIIRDMAASEHMTARLDPYPAASRLAEASALALDEAEREARTLRDMLEALDRAHQDLKAAHEECLRHMEALSPEADAELKALRALRAAEQVELTLLRNRLADILSM